MTGTNRTITLVLASILILYGCGQEKDVQTLSPQTKTEQAKGSSSADAFRSCVTAADQTPNGSRLLIADIGSRVERVHANGKVEQVFPPKSTGDQGKWFLSGFLLSPSQRLLAFNRSGDNNLWLYRLDNRVEEKLTRVGSPRDKQFASIDVVARLWSPDEKLILIEVVPGETDVDPDGDSPALKIRPAEYGFRIYDLDTGKYEALPKSIDGNKIAAWLRNGDFILATGPGAWNKNNKADTKLFQVSMKDSHPPIPLAELPAGSEFSQIRPSANGECLAMVRLSWKDKTSQIHQLHLSSKTIVPISPIGDFAEFQRPQFSPSGERVSYRHHRSVLIVNGIAVHSCKALSDYLWIDDAHLAVECFDAEIKGKRFINIVDPINGKTISQREAER